MINLEEKICKKCLVSKSFTDFNLDKTSRDGYRTICKVCKSDENKLYRQQNREKVAEYHKNYSIKNKKKLNDYVNNNREKINEIKARYRLNNPEMVEISKKQWRDKNLHINAFRNILKNSLIRLGKKKEGKTIDLLGYSALDLKNHITSLFTEGMTWENHGEWHIDHKVPVSKFSPDTPLNVVNVLDNLQPLWATTREINGVIYKGNLNKNKY